MRLKLPGGKELRFSIGDLDRAMDYAVWGYPSTAGVNVNEYTALRIVAVFAAIRVLAETVAQLPVHLYRNRSDGGKEPVTDHWLCPLLHDSPNPEMTSFEFRETLQAHLASWGNAYCEKEYQGGRVVALWPLRPDRMEIYRRNRELVYLYRRQSGATYEMPAWKCWHLRGLGFDGVVGYSPIALARESLGLTQAAEQFGASFFGNGALPGMVLVHPKALSEQARKNLRESWSKIHQGAKAGHTPAILEEDMRVEKIGIPPEDSQFLETRGFQVTEIARLFRLPPHMIADLSRSTFSNIEVQGAEFVMYSLLPWLKRWEASINKHLLPESETGRLFVKFNVSGLLRGDAAARSQLYASGIQNGWMSPNDARALEDMNPIEGGGQYFVQLNLVPLNMAADVVAEPEGQRTLETRADNKRLALHRARIAKSYRTVFADAGKRIVERETQNILRAAKKHLSERNLQSFEDWLTDFYRDFVDYVVRQIDPAVRGLSDAIVPIAMEEIKGKADEEKIREFLAEYEKAFALRYTGSNKGQILSLLRGENPLEAIEERLAEWAEREPQKVAMNETVQLSNAVARVAFMSAGVTFLAWQAIGADTCPICQEMDGKTVGIEQPFLGHGDTLESEGQSPYRVSRPTTHPPLHEGCQCQITAQ